MPNKVADHKRRISIVFDKDLLAAVDVAAKREGKTRTEYVTAALQAAVEPKPVPPSPATADQVDELKAHLALMASEVAHLRTLTDQVLQESRALPTPIVEPEPAPRKLSITERLTGRLKK